MSEGAVLKSKRSDGSGLDVVDHPERGVLEIQGVKYSYQLFAALGVGGLNPGRLFTVLQREDGTVTLLDFAQLDDTMVSRLRGK